MGYGERHDPVRFHNVRVRGDEYAICAGRDADAEPRLRRTLELFSDDAGARLMLARVLYSQGKYAEYAKETKLALQFAESWSSQPLPEVRDFLSHYEATGEGSALPPAPDPRILMGWNQD